MNIRIHLCLVAFHTDKEENTKHGTQTETKDHSDVQIMIQLALCIKCKMNQIGGIRKQMKMTFST